MKEDIGEAIVSLSANGTTISYTNNNGETESITTQDTTYSAATQSTAGLMSAADKKKLDGIASGATASTGDITEVIAGKGLTGGAISGAATLNIGAGTGISVSDDAVALATSGVEKGTYGPNQNVSGAEGNTILVPEVTVDEYGRITNIVNRTYTSKNTTYSEASESANGLMSAADKKKLNAIDSGAQVNKIETIKVNNTALSISNKAVNIDLSAYATTEAANAYADSLGSKYATAAQGAKADSAVQPGDIGGAAKKNVDTSISAGSTSTKLPTSQAVAAFVEGKGYTNNTGTVTSIATGGGLTGGPITSTGTISHADTSSQASITASGRKYITGVTLDGYGHVTGLTTGTETVTDTNTTYTYAAAKSKTNGNVTMDLTAGGSGSGTQSVKVKGTGRTSVTSDSNGVVSVDTSLSALTVGSKTYDGSTAVSITAADLGLSNALHFIGVKSSIPTSGTYANGDVILVGNKEYVYNNGWVELGDGSSYALKSIQVKAGSGLSGGGTIDNDVTISHGNTSDVSNVTANGRKYVTGLTFDDYGHVTGVTTGTETVTDTNTTYDLSAASASNGQVEIKLTAGGSGSGVDTISLKSAGATTITADSNNNIEIKSVNTEYSAGSGLSLANNVFSHSNVVTPTHVPGVQMTTANHITDYGDTITAFEPVYDANGHIVYQTTHNYWLPAAPEIPEKLPNPKTLNINGISYDGSADKTISIAEGSNVSITSTQSAITISANDTKNTAGATDTGSLLYLIGAKDQSAEIQTYSKQNVYVDASSHVYAPNFVGGLKTNGGNIILSQENYGSSLPGSGVGGLLYFVDENDGSLPDGGIKGQILIKNSNVDGDASWHSVAVNNNAGKRYVVETGDIGTGEDGLGYNTSIYTENSVLYGAAWNDYAEYRNQNKVIEPGYCVASADNGCVYKTTEKFQACDGIVSDTFGFAIGQTEQATTPLAVAGRVLAYFEGNREDYHAGDTVCAGPEGKIMKMTREEIREWPDRIVGIVSEIPNYEYWGTHNVKVNNRIWIKVK